MQYLIGSIASLTLPLYAPIHFWWLIFFFGTLTFQFAQSNITGVRTLLWATMLALSLTVDVVYALYRMSCSWHITIVLLVLLCYTILVYAGWLYSTHTLMISKPYIHQLALFTLSLWAQFMFVEYCFFVPLGALMGNPFFNPLIPFTTYPMLLWHLPYLRLPGSLALLCITSSTITLALHNKRAAYWPLLGVCCAVWLSGPLFYKQIRPPEWLERVAAIPLMVGSGNCTAILTHAINQITTTNPKASIFMLPESACQEHPQWHGNQTVVIGGYQQIDGLRYNTLFCLGANLQTFCKQQLLPFVEQQSFLSDCFGPLPTTTIPQKRASLELGPLSCIPLICSELFLTHEKPEEPECPLLCPSNDWWFKGIMPGCMHSVACLRAIEWHIPVLYVSYRYARFVDKNGNSKKLPSYHE